MGFIALQIKTRQPQEIYQDLLLNHEENDALRDPKQIRNKKYYDKMKNTTLRSTGNQKNFADNNQQVSYVLHDHLFLQSLEQTKNKISNVILYLEETIQQMKAMCSSARPSITGVDRTFNLGEVYVTVTVFKMQVVVHKELQLNPIFIGPLFLNGDAFDGTYAHFFTHLRNKFKEVSYKTENFIFETDQEKAMMSAIKLAFPESNQVLCIRHIKQNVESYLADKVGLEKEMRQVVMNGLFGSQGAVLSDDSIVFEERIKFVQNICKNK
nr:uncharacterized protein LOC124817963 [Hydra vulgaris]